VSSDIYDKDRVKHDHARSISKKTRQDIDWFRPSRKVIALRSILLYYAMEKLVAPDELRVTTYIDWRIAL
jgi:hypothetical protein